MPKLTKFRSTLKKFRRQILVGSALVAGVALIALLAWILYLDRIVTAQFEGRRWTLPAQVYAQPTELYVGQTFGADAFEQELRRLGYHRVDAPKEPGSYRRRGSRIDFVSRRFQFPDAIQESQALSVTAGANAIESIASGAEDVPIFRMDPLLIGSIFPIHGEDRAVVTPEEVPPLLPAALKVVEDRKFDTHHGVNFSAIVRAAWVNVRAGQIEQGGSTLTQQLVKSYFLDNRRTLGRKIEEAMMAMLLEVHFEKADLLNAYINEIYLGQDGRRAIHGFGLASQFYFGKPLAELQLQEVAVLVAIVRGPSYYDPRRHPDRVKARRDLILKLMTEHKVIDAKAAERAMKQPLGVVRAGTQAGSYYPAFLDLVRRTLRRDYREEDLTEAGLRIFSTLDPLVQARAEKSLTQELDRLEKAKKKKKPEPLEGVVVVTAPQNGEVVAMVGGRQATFEGFNRALDAKRSIGSLVKPVIYLAAMETGNFTAASIVEDGPVEVKLSKGKTWQPQNYSEEFYGPVPLVRALAQSMNLATVRLGMDVGLPKVIQEFKVLGLQEEPPQLPSVLLGSLDVSPLEVAQLYNAFASGGFNTPLRAVRSVLDAEGKPLKSFALEVTPVATPQAMYQVNQMLVQVMERGTGAAARVNLPSGLVVAGKSGTSSDYRDSWFAGFSGSHLAVVWIGYDDNTPTGLTGSSGSLAVWSRLMGSISTTPLSMPMPEGLQETYIEYLTGYGAKPGCGEELVVIAVPQGTQLPMKPGCEANVFGEIGERAKEWWQGIIR
ncbi:penicillin-binding protein 1B [Povalibacter uvarum]|uniref:Penicillin-binding protein 1B n=1 Tax=Povalibacter uvarum TaxID=732238 RepID=A0A841HJ96_9GAMM|nr:penicillin-binding protein 1B [Povalibacter uvarum]MBB6093087.1 penicillin-binding protein 1B [Povalibacter uvarum]